MASASLLARTLIFALFFVSISLPSWAIDCIDVSRKEPILLSGRLTHKIFPGPPNYEDVTKGDSPEPAYVLELESSACFFGDDFLSGNTDVSQVQLMVDDSEGSRLFGILHQLLGRAVLVVGRDAFGAHTGHHHAPLLMTVKDVSANADPTEAYGTAMTTVQAFYLALQVGDGPEAAEYVIPEKRKSGPLSAAELSSFYRSLKTPLRLIDITDLGAGRYKALYTFETQRGEFCNGSAVVATVSIDGRNLISGIVAENGC